jgi:hypothetical protein
MHPEHMVILFEVETGDATITCISDEASDCFRFLIFEQGVYLYCSISTHSQDTSIGGER